MSTAASSIATPAQNNPLSVTDPDVLNAINDERRRQENNIELIASENAAFPEVMEAQGSILTNKYAEGYPGKRYYGGCEHVDVVEAIAIERAQTLFGAEHANVQPHSGSSANMAVYMSELTPGDRILGMDLSEGGHLTHGSPVSFSGRIYEAHFYGLHPKTEYIDYDAVRTKAKEVQPKIIVAGASAYSRIIDFKIFREIADEVGAILLVDMAHIAGLVAAGLHPSPVPHADYVTTTTHKTLRGPRGGLILTREANAKKINSCIFPGIQGGPLMHVIAAKAVAFKLAMSDDFKQYQAQVIRNAQKMGEALTENGFPIVSGGTDNHLVLVSLLKHDVSGKKLERLLDEAGITTNKNAVPNDTRSRMITSGLRLGTPCITTRGMKEAEVEMIATWITEIAKDPDNSELVASVGKKVSELTRKFPLYPQT